MNTAHITALSLHPASIVKASKIVNEYINTAPLDTIENTCTVPQFPVMELVYAFNLSRHTSKSQTTAKIQGYIKSKHMCQVYSSRLK